MQSNNEQTTSTWHHKTEHYLDQSCAHDSNASTSPTVLKLFILVVQHARRKRGPVPRPADKGSPARRLRQSAHPIISTLPLPVISYDEPSPELTGDRPEAEQRPTGEP